MRIRNYFAIATAIFVGFVCRPTLQHAIPEKQPQQQPGLCFEFQLLRDTIPVNELIGVTNRHYRYDANFRRAMQFLQTMRFLILAKRLENSTPYRTMLAMLERENVNVTDIASIERIMDCLLLPPILNVEITTRAPIQMSLPGMKYEIINNVHVNVHNGKEVEKEKNVIKDDFNDYNDYGNDDFGFNGNGFSMNPRSMQSFALDILRIIPRQDFQSVAENEANCNPQFARFLKVFQNISFQDQILASLNSRALAGIVKTFRNNGIAIPFLLRVFFKMLSMAPTMQ